MSEAPKSKIGSILWTDITVPNADEVRDFYKEVVGWEAQGVNMGDYEDYSMIAPGNEHATTGICHARGSNTGLPPQWMIYVSVENLDQSIEAVKRLGGSVVSPIREMGESRFCVIKDPAGAHMALWQQ